MPVTDNINVKSIKKIVRPKDIIDELPLPQNLSYKITRWRNELSKIIHKNDNRLIVIVGPCSIHDYDMALHYAKFLARIKSKYQNRIFIIMRVYFEKPRTTVGWKGLINDPYLDNTFKINDGIKIARKLLLEINKLDIPVGCEFLDVFTPQYYADLVTWGAIGARTTECQLHRQLASGLSMPIGFKNGTGGSIDIAADAIIAASSPHVFLGINNKGNASIVETTGNKNLHIILRGGKAKTNYDVESINNVYEILKSKNLVKRVMVDMSHGNSKKIHTNQILVCDSISSQITQGNNNIIGVMIESNLKSGNQKLVVKEDLEWGVSITDACIDLDTTCKLLDNLYNALNVRFPKRKFSEVNKII